MTPRGYSGAQRKLNTNKNLKSKISCQAPFKCLTAFDFSPSTFLACLFAGYSASDVLLAKCSLACQPISLYICSIPA
jgi:hypothetical protein